MSAQVLIGYGCYQKNVNCRLIFIDTHHINNYNTPLHKYMWRLIMATRGKIEIYETSFGWEWRFIAINGEILAHPAETFSSKQACMASIDTVTQYFVDFNNQGLITEIDIMGKTDDTED